MSRAILWEETSEALNVSQDYETPPRASNPANERLSNPQVTEDSERVEDSYGNTNAKTCGGVIEYPQSPVAAEDEEEDLYGTSPRAKERLALTAPAKGIAKSQSAQVSKASQSETVSKVTEVASAEDLPRAQQSQSRESRSFLEEDSYPKDSQPKEQDAAMPAAGNLTRPAAKSQSSRGTRASNSRLVATQESGLNSVPSAEPAASAAKRQTGNAASIKQANEAKNTATINVAAATPSTAADIALGSKTRLNATERLEARKKAKHATCVSNSPLVGSQTTNKVNDAAELLPTQKQDDTTCSTATGKAKVPTQPNAASKAKQTQEKAGRTVAAASSTLIPSSALPNGTDASKNRFDAGAYDFPASPGGRKPNAGKAAASKKRATAANKKGRQPANRAKQTVQPSSSVTAFRKLNFKAATSGQDNYNPSQTARESLKPKPRVTRASARGQASKPAGVYAEKDSSDEANEHGGKQLIQAAADVAGSNPVTVPEDQRHPTKEDLVVSRRGDRFSDAPETRGELGLGAEEACRPPNEAHQKVQVSMVADKGKQIDTTEPLLPAAANGIGPPPQTGASQNAAILVSDRTQSSPGVDPEPHPEAVKQTVEPRGVAQPQQNPTTPANIRSSPPLRGVVDGPSRGTSRVRDSTGQRPKIIGFSRSGPLNQGAVSALKANQGSVLVSRPGTATRKAPLAPDASRDQGYVGPRRTHDRSSVALSMHSTRTDRSVAPGNVANDVTDALAGLIGKSNFPAMPLLASKAKPRNQHSEQAPELAIEPEKDHDHFAVVGDFNDDTFMPYEGREIDEEIAQPTYSQIAMPPPPAKRAPGHKVPIAPMTRDPVEAYEVSDSQPLLPEHPQPTVPVKRTDEIAVLEPRAAMQKKPKHTLLTQLEPDQIATDPKEPFAPKPEVVPKLPQATGNGGRAKPVPKVASDLELPVLPVVIPESLRRSKRKINRHSSQGGQTVDLHGSPIPTALEVPHLATVLETFSQQTQMSSEDEAVLEALTRQKRDVAPVKKPTPTKPTRKLSRNAKTVPSQPNIESQAAAAMILGKLKSQHLILNQRSTEPDPFISSEEAAAERPKRRVTSAFLNQLMAGVPKDEEEFDDDARGSRQQAPEGNEDSDPDKTLVESRSPKRTHRGKPKQKPYESDSDFSSSHESSASSQDTSIVEDDMTSWRNALQPHQANLFDELVGVSHQLVRHLVDRETATQHIVSDYRRRGENLIKQMQLLHDANRKDHVEVLRKRKQDMGEKLNGAAGDLERLKGSLENRSVGEPAPERSRLDCDDALQQALELYG